MAKKKVATLHLEQVQEDVLILKVIKMVQSRKTGATSSHEQWNSTKAASRLFQEIISVEDLMESPSILLWKNSFIPHVNNHNTYDQSL